MLLGGYFIYVVPLSTVSVSLQVPNPRLRFLFKELSLIQSWFPDCQHDFGHPVVEEELLLDQIRIGGWNQYRHRTLHNHVLINISKVGIRGGTAHRGAKGVAGPPIIGSTKTSVFNNN